MKYYVVKKKQHGGAQSRALIDVYVLANVFRLLLR
jgi:hypothetical protein